MTNPEADAARFRWWFSNGMATLDQWRAAIDKAMKAEDEAEDAQLHELLEASLARARKASETVL